MDLSASNSFLWDRGKHVKKDLVIWSELMLRVGLWSVLGQLSCCVV